MNHGRRMAWPWRGWWRHLLLTLRLNFRSRQPLIYGYLVPMFFLLAFGSVFRASEPPLLHEMGQLLTITILGGACFGLPTALVAERELGVWKRYRLLPASAVGIVLSTTVARTLLLGSAVAMQIGLAWLIYRTPWPAYPGQLAAAFLAVDFAFLGLGLLIAMLADNVPAVQALGQAVFLPMIMIGGVGVSLESLPEWARRVAGFLPGKYAVEALQACVVPDGGGLARTGGALAALGVIGAAGFVAASGLFRWEAGPRRRSWRAWGWVGVALAAWIGVGSVGELARLSRERNQQQKLQAIRKSKKAGTGAPSAQPWQALTEKDLRAIPMDDLPPDEGQLVPLTNGFDQLTDAAKDRVNDIRDQLAYWPPGKVDDPVQRLRNLLSVCALADLVMDVNEWEIARAVFDQARDALPEPATRQKVAAWVALHPEEGPVIKDASEFGIRAGPPEALIRERVAKYAKKLLRQERGNPPGQP